MQYGCASATQPGEHKHARLVSSPHQGWQREFGLRSTWWMVARGFAPHAESVGSQVDQTGKHGGPAVSLLSFCCSCRGARPWSREVSRFSPKQNGDKASRPVTPLVRLACIVCQVSIKAFANSGAISMPLVECEIVSHETIRRAPARRIRAIAPGSKSA